MKAQRGGSTRALRGDPKASVGWLTEPLLAFGDRLGAVLFRIPDAVAIDAQRLASLLAAWPTGLPLVIEARHPSWEDDAVHRLMAEHGAVRCSTELPDGPAPSLTLTGDFLYVRLRRLDYEADGLATWADRLVPFLEGGHDVFAFFRHDDVGRAPELAAGLVAAVRERLGDAAVARAG